MAYLLKSLPRALAYLPGEIFLQNGLKRSLQQVSDARLRIRLDSTLVRYNRVELRILTDEMPQTHEITELLQAWSKGDSQALAELIPLVDHELRNIAHAYMKRERAGHILQTTALVAEALIRLLGQDKISWQSRKHFYALVAKRMRQVLIEYAREQLAAKRGNRIEHVDVAEAVWISVEESQELVILHEALLKLAKLDERKAKTVEYRHFGGYNLEEIAELLEVSQSTVEREWRLARAWLRREMCASVTQ